MNRRLIAWMLLALVAAGGVQAKEHTVPAEPGALASVLAELASGDVLTLAAGVHHGPIRVEVPRVILQGEPGAVIDAGGEGSVVTISAADVVLRGLTIRGSGTRLDKMDSGIFVDKAGHRARVEDNTFEVNLFGVYLWGPEEALVRGNRITGRTDLRMSERGNGVSVWNSPGSRVVDNRIRHGRDGIFSNISRDNVFRGNELSDLRFAVHYMYTNNSEVSENVSRGNHVGYALMFSQGLTVRGNRSHGDRDHGIALNYANGSEFMGNVVRNGGEKCVFIYNSNNNAFHDNWFEGCRIGIHFTAGSEGNRMAGNAFVSNATQVKYVGTRHLDWSHQGRGNYWSDNPAFDLDGDGIADTAYRPNDIIDTVLWAYPMAKLLLNSPAVQVVRWAQSQFPGLHPGGVVDSAPLMRPPGIDVGTGGRQ